MHCLFPAVIWRKKSFPTTNYPNVYIVLGKRIIDLSGMSSEEQIYSLANVELNGYDAKTPVIVAATLRIDS